LEYEILRALISLDRQVFLKSVFDANNGGPIVGLVEGTKNHIRFLWEDGRFFISIRVETIDGVDYYVDEDGNNLTLKEIRKGVSKHIKRGPPSLSDV
jgi:hypothetical protein